MWLFNKTGSPKDWPDLGSIHVSLVMLQRWYGEWLHFAAVSRHQKDSGDCMTFAEPPQIPRRSRSRSQNSQNNRVERHYNSDMWRLIGCRYFTCDTRASQANSLKIRQNYVEWIILHAIIAIISAIVILQPKIIWRWNSVRHVLRWSRRFHALGDAPLRLHNGLYWRQTGPWKHWVKKQHVAVSGISAKTKILTYVLFWFAIFKYYVQ